MTAGEAFSAVLKVIAAERLAELNSSNEDWEDRDRVVVGKVIAYEQLAIKVRRLQFEEKKRQAKRR